MAGKSWKTPQLVGTAQCVGAAAGHGTARGAAEGIQAKLRSDVVNFTSSFEELGESSLESTLILRSRVLGNGKAGAVFASSLSLHMCGVCSLPLASPYGWHVVGESPPLLLVRCSSGELPPFGSRRKDVLPHASKGYKEVTLASLRSIVIRSA